MNELIAILQTTIERGLIFSLVVAAVYVSSKLIKFDNLAIEGAFGLGGATAALMLTHTNNPLISILGALAVGALSGIATGFLHTQLKLNNLISGIVITTSAFSFMLKIAGSNMILPNSKTIFHLFQPFLESSSSLITLILIVSAIFFIIAWFLKTEVGLLLHVVGDTPQMLTNLGKNRSLYIIISLTLSNMLAALSGALFVHYTGYFSIWTGVGILIVGLAGLILAQLLSTGFDYALILGAIIYQAIIALTFELQLNQDWNKLITALLIVILIAIKQFFDQKQG